MPCDPHEVDLEERLARVARDYVAGEILRFLERRIQHVEAAGDCGELPMRVVRDAYQERIERLT